MIGGDIVSIRRVMRANCGLCDVLVVFTVVHSLVTFFNCEGFRASGTSGVRKGREECYFYKESWIV